MMVSTTGTRIRIRTGLTTWGGEEMLGVSIQEVDTAHQREEDESNKEPHLHVFRLDLHGALWEQKRRRS